MTMGTCALAVDTFVLLLAELRSCQTMGSSEMGADREEGVHGMSEIVGPEAWLFVKAQCRDGQMRTQPSPDLPDDGLRKGLHALTDKSSVSKKFLRMVLQSQNQEGHRPSEPPTGPFVLRRFQAAHLQQPYKVFLRQESPLPPMEVGP